ncbi:MAG: surface carbohydrate biosynthesis protein [Alphaproteobacteria bacterium]
MKALPPLLIPAETRSREFDAKLLLACVAAERGFRAIVGSRIHMHLGIARLPRGIYLAKDVRRPSHRMFRILRSLGHAIVAWDEEGLIFITPALYHRRRVHAATLAMVETYLAWGRQSGELIRTAPGYPGCPIELTGNPRIDLLRPELRALFAPEADELRARHGDFVLVNTNFGRLNHFNPALSLTPSAAGEASRRNLEPDDPPLEVWRHRETIMHAMEAMVPVLARALPDHRIVVRPHPSENHERWRRAGEGLANVAVVHEGPIAPWLMAARAVVHNGCTTGLEGRLLGRPVFAYRPDGHAGFDKDLPNRLSQEARSLDDLIAMLKVAVGNSRPVPLTPAQGALLGDYIVALDGPLASDRIADALVAFAARRPLAPPPLGDRLAARASATARALIKRLNALRPGHKDSADFRDQRFPGVDLATVEARIQRLGALLGRFQGLRARVLADNVFEVLAP